VKSNKKINEIAQTANFTDFPLISCGNGPSWTKTMQAQTLFSLLQFFSKVSRVCHMKADVLPFLKKKRPKIIFQYPNPTRPEVEKTYPSDPGAVEPLFTTPPQMKQSLSAPSILEPGESTLPQLSLHN